MASNIQVRATCNIKDGKLESFKQVAAECVAAVKAKDTGTTQYDWFFNEDESVCVVRETYENSDALMQHMGHLGDLLPRLGDAADMEIEIFGEPSPTLADATAAFQPKVWKSFVGL